MGKVAASGWITWILAALFYAYQYVLRVLPNIMMENIMVKYQIDASIFGQFSGVYYIGYALAHVPLGILLDRFGPRRVLPLCVLTTTLGLLPLLYANMWAYPLVGRCLIGIGSSGAVLGLFKVIRMIFPEDRFTRMLGMAVTIGLIGAIYGGEPIRYLLGLFGWEQVLLCIIAVGFVLGITMVFVLPAYVNTEAYDQNIFKSIKRVLSNKMVLLVCVLGGCMVGPLEGFADVWGAEYLKRAYRLNESVAASLPSLIFLGMCVGSPFLSYVADRFQAYFQAIIVSGLVMGLGFVSLLYMRLSVFELSVMFFVVGIFCAYQIPTIYKATTYVRATEVGLTTAVANMIIMLFGYLFHSSIGRLMDVMWQGELVHGIKHYSVGAYTASLSLIPLGLLIGSVGFSVLLLRSRR